MKRWEEMTRLEKLAAILDEEEEARKANKNEEGEEEDENCSDD